MKSLFIGLSVLAIVSSAGFAEDAEESGKAENNGAIVSLSSCIEDGCTQENKNEENNQILAQTSDEASEKEESLSSTTILAAMCDDSQDGMNQDDMKKKDMKKQPSDSLNA